MAVLVEGISVVIRRPAIEGKFPGGWSAFAESVPNATLCADEHLARVGFMHPSDVEAYLRDLRRHGIVYLVDATAQDLVVVDQQRGPMARCSWIDVGKVEIGAQGTQRVTACRLAGDEGKVLIWPDSWVYEGSLSQTFGFVPTGEEKKSLRFLRREDGAEIYANQATGEVVYVGRTSKDPLLDP